MLHLCRVYRHLTTLKNIKCSLASSRMSVGLRRPKTQWTEKMYVRKNRLCQHAPTPHMIQEGHVLSSMTIAPAPVWRRREKQKPGENTL